MQRLIPILLAAALCVGCGTSQATDGSTAANSNPSTEPSSRAGGGGGDLPTTQGSGVYLMSWDEHTRKDSSGEKDIQVGHAGKLIVDQFHPTFSARYIEFYGDNSTIQVEGTTSGNTIQFTLSKVASGPRITRWGIGTIVWSAQINVTLNEQGGVGTSNVVESFAPYDRLRQEWGDPQAKETRVSGVRLRPWRQ